MLENLLSAEPSDYLNTAIAPSTLPALFDLPSVEETRNISHQRLLKPEEIKAQAQAEEVQLWKEKLPTYDWDFETHAQSLRGYSIAKLIEETEHADARYRLKALELLGKVTEVALFTERSVVKQVGMTDKELDEMLKKRLAKFLALQQSTVEGEVLDSGGMTENSA